MKKLIALAVTCIVGIVVVLGIVFLGPETPSGTPPDSASAPEAEQGWDLISKDASELVLVVADFEPGWVQRTAEPATKEGAQSAYHAYFHKGIFYPPVVQNYVAIYPSTDLAKQVYLGEEPANVSLEYPKIGDECFLDISVSINQCLVFRKCNVVVWLWLQQDPFGDIESYARIIEGKIG